MNATEKAISANEYLGLICMDTVSVGRDARWNGVDVNTIVYVFHPGIGHPPFDCVCTAVGRMGEEWVYTLRAVRS